MSFLSVPVYDGSIYSWKVLFCSMLAIAERTNRSFTKSMAGRGSSIVAGVVRWRAAQSRLAFSVFLVFDYYLVLVFILFTTF